jgi:outer membrane PBP1 activator LpoA protein
MISLRLAVPAVLLAAALAGCFTYFVNPSPPVEADQRLPPSLSPTNIDQHPAAKEQAAAAFERAAAAIIRRAEYAQASANEPPITGHIPLPRRRPLPR